MLADPGRPTGGADPTPSLRFGVLGPLTVEIDGSPLAIPSHRQRALLVLLLIAAGEVVPSERLVEQLWDGAPPPRAGATLRAYVSHLRRALGGRSGAGAVLTTRGRGYALEVPRDAVDAARLRELTELGHEHLRRGRPAEAEPSFRAAVALWRGDPLPEVADHDVARPTVAALTEVYLSAVEGRFEALLGTGRHLEALPGLEEFCAHHPLREGPRALQMLGLYRAARAADALEVYRRFRAVLRDDLGLEPSARLERLHQQVLSRDADLDLAGSASAARDPAGSPRDQAHVRPVVPPAGASGAGPPPETVEFRLMGASQVLVHGAPVPLPGAAERSVLALLLLTPGRVVASGSLVDRLWAETRLPADPLNALQLRVAKLRRALAVHRIDVITRDGPGYRADVEPSQVDLHRFSDGVRAARSAARSSPADAAAALVLYDRALALWRGDPLADFAGEGWATVELARLEQLHRAAVTERAELALALGRHVEVAADLGPLVADDPRQEALAGLLMTALFRAGQQADALEVFARTRRHLDDELGLQPSAALRTLHQRILGQDDRLAGPSLPDPVAAAPPSGRSSWHLERQVPAVGQTAAAAPRPTVPAPTVRLVGRQDDLSRLVETLAQQRLVTLVGPGGAGKTSLALAAASRAEVCSGRDVHLVRLAQVGTPTDVPLAVADALGVPLDGAGPDTAVRSRLLGYLAHRRALLVLDNCEHVIDAVAGLVDDVLRGAEHVTVLATSREALAVPGELQLSVGPLAAPPPGTPADRIPDYPAAALFLERARAVRSRLDLGDADLLALAQVCRQLDGLPLALELAAARMSSLSLTELSERLSDRFGLLTTGARTAETRQRTLRATVEWSHALLSDEEQRAFRRLAVFQGGCTAAGAEAVIASEDLRHEQVFDVLDRLVNRSMVVLEPGTPSRFRMLETLREYAYEQLVASGEREQVAARHASYVRSLAEAAERELRGRGQRAALARLRAEHADLRAALAWLAADPGRIEEGLRLAGALALFWHLGRHLEGREVLAALLPIPGGTRDARARALQAVSIVERPRACLVHPSALCAAAAQQSLDLFEAEGDAHRAALSQVLLAVELLDGSDPVRLAQMLADAEERFTVAGDEWGVAVAAFVRLQDALRRGEVTRCLALGRTASDAFRRLDDAWGLSAVLYHLGWGLKEFGRYADAVPVLEQAIAVSTAAGVFNTAQWALFDLGGALLALGDRSAALAAFDRAATASAEVGDAAGDVLARLGRATVAQIDGDTARARPLFADAADGLSRLGTPLWAGHAEAGVAWCDWRDGLGAAAARRYAQVQAAGERFAEPTLVATAHEGLARVAVSTQDLAAARSWLRRAAEVRAEATRPAPPHEQRDLDELWSVVADARPGGGSSSTTGA